MSGVSLTTCPSLQHRCVKATCRSCGQRGLEPVLDLGPMPLTAAFLTRAQLGLPEKRYPLEVAFCRACSLVQIIETVPPGEMFRSDYPYFSSYSTAWLGHCRQLAMDLIRERRLGPRSLAVELASNDGCFLRHLVEKGVPCLGIDPAKAPAAVARGLGISTLCEFFDHALAEEVLRDYGPADIVVGMNVLAHVDRLHSFVDGVKRILADDGVAVFEFPYVRDLVECNEFDTIYHEHLCYYSLTSVSRLLGAHGLFVNRAIRLASHGGSLRVYAEHRARPEPVVNTLLEQEEARGMLGLEYYEQLRTQTERFKLQMNDLLRRLNREGSSVVAYGAAAKGVIQLNYAEIDETLVKWVADLNIHKQGLYMPGVRLPVCSPERLLIERPDYLMILPWNLSEEIMAQHAEFQAAGGRFIIPIPEPRIV